MGDRGRGRQRSRFEEMASRPSVVAGVAGVSLVLVVAMVFAMAAGARRISNQAATLQSFSITAEKADEARHLVGVAALLVASGSSTGPDDVARASDALDELSNVVDSGTPPDVVELSRFVDTGRSLLGSVQSGEDPSAVETRIDEFAIASSELDDRYESARSERLDELESANRFLARFGALGGGAVAFVVPAVSVYLHRRLRSDQLRLHEDHARDRWRLMLHDERSLQLLDELDAVIEMIDDRPDLAGQRLTSLVTDTRLRHGGVDVRPIRTDIGALISERPELPGLPRHLNGPARKRGESAYCSVDPGLMSAALGSIEWAMSRCGAAGVSIEVGSAESDGRRRVGLRAIGHTETSGMVEVAGPVRAANALLASSGIDFEADEDNMQWSLSVPVGAA